MRLRDVAADHVPNQLLRLISAVLAVITSLPSRRTEMRSEICRDSSSAWEM